MPLQKVNRKRLRRKANRMAARKTAAKRARLEGKKAAAKRGFRNDVAASRGASKVARSAIRSQLGDLSADYGLKGRTLRQTEDELRGQLRDARRTVPFERAGLRADLNETLQGLDDQLFTASEAEASKADTIYNSLLSHEKSRVKKHNQRVRDRRQARAEHEADVDKALTEIRNEIAKSLGPGEGPLNDQRRALREDPALRRALQDYLISSQDTDPRAAREAIKRFLQIAPAIDSASRGARSVARGVDAAVRRLAR